MESHLPTVYGIRNCDTVKRARQWFDAHGQPYHFHDFKVQGVPADALDRWIADLGWEALVNRQGTTWRKLAEAERAVVRDAAGARAVMLAHASVIKRPVVAWPAGAGTRHTVGMQTDLWAACIADAPR